jgi:holliday junction DNA helicase RuvA
MIGKIAGRLDYRATDHVLIDVRGVGYVVYVSERTLAALPGPGEACALYTELMVREDLLQLFGFLTLVEKEWHRLLISVQGVGAKAAMAILGALGPDGVARALTLGDAAAIRKAPGIGPKLAQRVVMELKDKAPSVMALGATGPDLDDSAPLIEDDASALAPTASASASAKPSARKQSAQAQADALSALTNLGYGPSEAAQAIAQAAQDESETPALIRAALKLLAPK